MLTIKKVLFSIVALLASLSLGATMVLAITLSAKAPIELWQTLCNDSKLKSMTITKTFKDGRVETNDYYCVK